MGKYSVVGKAVPRVDGLAKVTGEAIYGADLQLPGMLYGKILRSPLPHARLLGIDTSRAEQLPGVRGVITARDIPPYRFGGVIRDEEVFAREKVRYVGERVAAVAAESPEIAEEALRWIRVEYQELPAVLDPLEAMRPEAPILHEDLASYEPGESFSLPLPPTRERSNICYHHDQAVGDLEQGFAESDRIFEDTFTTPIVHQGYLEPHAAVACFDAAGRLTVWETTQGSFFLRGELAALLKMPLNKIKVIPTVIGGGFGGKLGLLITPACVFLARKTGRPVQLAISREEELAAANPRHPSIIQIKTGVKRDGTLMARQVKVIYDTGAYADIGPVVAMGSSSASRGPYRIPHARLEGYCVYTNKLSCGAYRAPGYPQTTFAFESQMDIIAQALQIDPLELRLKNGLREGDLSFVGRRLDASSFQEVLQKAAQEIGWDKPLEGKNRGRGLACGQWVVASNNCNALVRLNEDGTIGVSTGCVDLTGTNTAMAQIVAEELGVSLEEITIVTGDTDTAPYAPSSGGSWTTYNMGNAARLAAEDARQQLLELASKTLDLPAEELELKDGRVSSRRSPQQGMTLAELARASQRSRNRLILGRGSSAGLPPVLVFIAQAAEVEVDPETGEVTLRKMAAAQDVGRAINPQIVEGQIQGGVSQGVGFALSEELRFEQGAVINPSLATYRMPTALDLPAIQPVLIEQPSEKGPYGAKGVGEPPQIPTAAAVANAISAATGIRVKDLPLTPERILQALRSKER